MGLTRQGTDFQHASYSNTIVLRVGGLPRSLVRSLQGQGFDLGLSFSLVFTPGDGTTTRQVRSKESVDFGHFRSGYLT